MTEQMIDTMGHKVPGKSSLAASLAELQKDLPDVAKTLTANVKGKTKDGTPISYTYGYADLSLISKAILPKLAALGLSWVTRPTLNDAGQMVLVYKLQNDAGEFEGGEWPLPKGTPQEMGSAITYARRYCLCAVTGLAPAGDDDDAEKTTRAATRRRGADATSVAEPDRQRQPANGWPLQPADEPATPAGITSGTMRALQALCGKRFGKDRQARIDYAMEIIDRPITSYSELSEDEAGRVRRRLELQETADTEAAS